MSNGEPRIQFCTAEDGVRIAYATMGEGPPLVYMPGWVSHLELDWQNAEARPFFQRLARGHRVIRFDGRGTGLSDRDVTEISQETHVRDLAAVVDHLGLDRFALFSWSQRSPAALRYAAAHPERLSHLVLFAALCSGPKEHESSLVRALINLIRAEWGVGARATLGFVHPDADKEQEQLALDYLRAASSGQVAARILEEGMLGSHGCDELARATAPALILHRRGDNAVPMEAGREVASLLPNARFVVLDGDHHLPFQGDTDSVLRAVEEFLGVEPPEPAPERASHRPAATAAADAPVTLLFTDIEASTAATQRLGDARAQELVRTHNTIVRDALAAHGGREVKHTGDGIMASFAATSRALECAIAVQRSLVRHNEAHPDAEVRVRIGLNTGEPVREEDDLFGTAVQLARRICDQAEPGQIVVSNVVRELVAGKGFLFSDRGEAAVRGFEDPLRLYEVHWQE